MELRSKIAEYNEELIELRHYFHSHPEVSWNEWNTQKKITEYLDALNIPYVKAAKTGVIACIEGPNSGETILGIRADIDALPMQDLSDCSCVSENDGAAHSCGHDTHTAVLLMTAKLLSELRSELKIKVRLIFQPAEEFIEDSGAAYMKEEALVKECDRIIGLHIWSSVPSGFYSLMDGPIMASADTFDITISGKGGHGAHPDECIDPIPAAAELVSSLQRIVSRELSPREPAVLSVTSIHAGTNFNIIPAEAKLSGTCRSFSNEIRNQFPDLMNRVCQGVAVATDTKIKLDFHYGTPATVNDPKPVETGRRAADRVFGEEHFFPTEPSMGGEDFAKYEAEKCFLILGGGLSDPAKRFPQHSPYYVIDEQALKYGVEYFLRYVEEYQQELH